MYPLYTDFCRLTPVVQSLLLLLTHIIRPIQRGRGLVDQDLPLEAREELPGRISFAIEINDRRGLFWPTSFVALKTSA